jgi:hypothetical protein
MLIKLRLKLKEIQMKAYNDKNGERVKFREIVSIYTFKLTFRHSISRLTGRISSLNIPAESVRQYCADKQQPEIRRYEEV